jgi:hypothetical protein
MAATTIAMIKGTLLGTTGVVETIVVSMANSCTVESLRLRAIFIRQDYS